MSDMGHTRCSLSSTNLIVQPTEHPDPLSALFVFYLCFPLKNTVSITQDYCILAQKWGVVNMSAVNYDRNQEKFFSSFKGGKICGVTNYW